MDIKKQMVGGAVLLLSSIVLVGHTVIDHAAKAAVPAAVKSSRRGSAADHQLTVAQRQAAKHRAAYLAGNQGLPVVYSGPGAAYTATLATALKTEARLVDAVVRGLVVQTTDAPFEHTAHTLYTLFVTAVYAGDTALKGQTVPILTVGGRIQGAELAAQRPLKGAAPKEQQTAAQLNDVTLVRADGFDPAAPGDEIVATLTKVPSPALQQDVYMTISPEWFFYKPQGTAQFVMHAQPTLTEITAGSHGYLQGPDARITRGQIVADVNTMVRTGRIPG